MDMAEAEVEALGNSELAAELEATFGGDDDVAGGTGGDLDEYVPHLEEDVADPVAERVVLEGLDEVVDPELETSAVEDRPEADEPPPPPELEPWEETSDPSPLGYCYYRGRQVLRIQRGKPAHSVSISCYRHNSCTLLLGMTRCPPDHILKQWCFEVEANPPGATRAARVALAREHMALGKGRWSAAAFAKAAASAT